MTTPHRRKKLLATVLVPTYTRPCENIPRPQRKEKSTSPLFHIAELVRIGVEDEKSGVAFYSALAQKTRNPELKKTYAGLAEQERYHQKRFEKTLEDLAKRLNYFRP